MKSRAQLRFARLLVVAAGAAALATTAACASGGDEPEPREEPTEGQAQQEMRATPLETIIDAAREDAVLTASQEDELDALLDEAAGERESFRALRAEIRRVAVDVVRADTADAATRERLVAEAVRAVEERVRRSLDALEAVHAVLTPEQRAAVAGNLRVRLEEHVEERLEARRERRREHAKAREADGLRRLAAYLLLSPEQVEELQAIQKEMLAEKKRLRPRAEELHALIDAFEGEHFGEALDALHEEKSRILRVRFARASDKAGTVLGILTAAQRELLADLILEGPSKLLLGDAAAERE
jgi:hypothetical protein